MVRGAARAGRAHRSPRCHRSDCASHHERVKFGPHDHPRARPRRRPTREPQCAARGADREHARLAARGGLCPLRARAEHDGAGRVRHARGVAHRGRRRGAPEDAARAGAAREGAGAARGAAGHPHLPHAARSRGMTTLPLPRWHRAAVGLLAGALLALGIAETAWPWVVDDAFISLRYADRLVAGDGLTWTDGERVEGYSNLLWVL